MIEYYPTNIIFNSVNHYCIWFTEEKDGLITESNRVKAFSSLNKLNSYAEKENIKITDDLTNYNIDYAKSWLRNKNLIDCKIILDFWNLFDDIAKSLNIGFYGNTRNEQIDNVYDRLFWGCNLPAVTPEDKAFIPLWTRKEIRLIAKVIKDGLKIIEKYVI